METNNQDRKKHHSSEGNYDEDYTYDDNYGRPNQMSCPYMKYCCCMYQDMNYKSMKMNRGQGEQPDTNSDFINNTDDFRIPGFNGFGLGLLGLGYPGYGYGYPDYGYPGYSYGYPGYGYGWGHNDWDNHDYDSHNWHGNGGWHRNEEAQE